MRGIIHLQKSTANFTINAGFEQFVRVKRNTNLSEASIRYYQDGMRYFTEFFNGENYCYDVTLDVIEDYIAYQKSKDISSVSVNSYIRSLRTVLYFFMEREYMPKFKIRSIRAEKKVKNTYTDAELKLLLAKPDVKRCSFAEYRNWVISNYLLATGNRLGTVCELKIGDVDFVNHEVLLRKLKSRRQYVIPLSVRLEKVLLDYLLYRKGGVDDYLFCNRCGGKMEKSSLATAIKRYNRERGVEKTSIHLYRHTFAKNWILNGGDIFRLKSILGHSSIDIVKEYAEMFGSDLKRNFDRFNPLDNFGEQKDSSRQSIKMSKN
ncbi:MAG: tyrosine-type recombinase/integrase [Nitrososphaerota archaeon]|jgi:integrase/recombinase XerD|nr:tyrosine-type recombinase/integrase [Nitrososphaerota archaeon]